MSILKHVNAALAFVLELAMLAGFGYAGYQVSPGSLPGWVLAVGLPVGAMVVWGIFFAPRSIRRLSIVPGALLSLGLFLLSAAALWWVGQSLAAGAVAALAVVNRVLVLVWRQW